MKKIAIYLCGLWACCLMACSNDNEIGYVEPWEEEYVLPQGKSDADDRIVAFYEQYNRYILYEYTYLDLRYELGGWYDYELPDPACVGDMLDLLDEVWFDFYPEDKHTNIEQALQYVTNSIKKRCTCFLISDFIDEHDFSHALAIANRKHDVVALRVYDPRENVLPPVGMMFLTDAETGEQMWVDTSDKRVREEYSKYMSVWEKELKNVFKRSGVDVADIRSDEDYVMALISLFKRRS